MSCRRHWFRGLCRHRRVVWVVSLSCCRRVIVVLVPLGVSVVPPSLLAGHRAATAVASRAFGPSPPRRRRWFRGVARVSPPPSRCRCQVGASSPPRRDRRLQAVSARLGPSCGHHHRRDRRIARKHRRDVPATVAPPATASRRPRSRRVVSVAVVLSPGRRRLAVGCHRRVGSVVPPSCRRGWFRGVAPSAPRRPGSSRRLAHPRHRRFEAALPPPSSRHRRHRRLGPPLRSRSRQRGAGTSATLPPRDATLRDAIAPVMLRPAPCGAAL